jgi:superfamily I DNA and/or RNA helicase
LQVESGNGIDFNISLFERLINEGVEPSRLVKQYRMRPEISEPVRALMYRDLQDAATVLHRAAFQGSQANAFFVSHGSPEGGDQNAGLSSLDSMSKTNLEECHLIVAIVQYCIRQGYRLGDVVVLTPYLGQLHLLRCNLQAARLAALVGNRDMDELVDHGLANPV